MRPLRDDGVRGALARLREETSQELVGSILPFYGRVALDETHGGFVGAVDDRGRPVPDAAKRVLLTSRILWTFSRATLVAPDPTFRLLADRAADALHRNFWDRRHGGVVVLTDPDGTVLDRRKHTYDQGFALFGLAEHHRATGHPRSLERAVVLYHLLERRAFDRRRGGYADGRRADWAPGRRERLRGPRFGRTSTNTHLHLLEAYTALAHVWDGPDLRRSLHRLVDILLDRCYDPDTTHFRQNCDGAWRPLDDEVSYGHDLETCWLLGEALDLLGDHPRDAAIRDLTLAVARASMAEGIDDDGGLSYRGGRGGVVDRQKIWWAQAEAVVGLLDAFERSGDTQFLHAALGVWRFVRDRLVDPVIGEWRSAPGGITTFREYDGRIGPMKGPYHNGRMCMEVTTRVDRLLAR